MFSRRKGIALFLVNHSRLPNENVSFQNTKCSNQRSNSVQKITNVAAKRSEHISFFSCTITVLGVYITGIVYIIIFFETLQFCRYQISIALIFIMALHHFKIALIDIQIDTDTIWQGTNLAQRFFLQFWVFFSSFYNKRSSRKLVY